MCSYETKIGITGSGRWQSKWASFSTASKWNGHVIVHKNYSYHVVSILFVAVYHISCSNEFVICS